MNTSTKKRKPRETELAREKRLAREAREYHLAHDKKALYYSFTWKYDPVHDDWVPRGLLPHPLIVGRTLREYHPDIYQYIVGLQELKLKTKNYLLSFHKEKHGYIVERWYQFNPQPKKSPYE